MGRGFATLRCRLTQSSCRTWVLSTPSPLIQSLSIICWARSCFWPAARSCAYSRILVNEILVRHSPFNARSSFVELIARPRRRPLQIQPLAKPGQRTPARAIISLALANNLLQAISKQGTDRGPLLRGQYSNFAEQRVIKFQG